ncbi:MAG TPA: ATP-binding protein [Pseudolysinimonas sp.]
MGDSDLADGKRTSFMRDLDPFGQDELADLVHLDEGAGPGRLQTREGTTKEFKENFTFGSIGAFARTMAAFANARGGYLIFGVTDNPRTVTGLSAASIARFDSLDQAKFTQNLNDIFSPEMHWEATLYELRPGRAIGVIYTHEAEHKPVIARKNVNENNAGIREGDILYRYHSRTERIKFPELRQILDDAKLREQRAMMRHVEALIRAGASNAAVLDFGASSIHGPTGQTVLMDEELVSKLSFIKKGEFEEVHGAPTLRVVGDVIPVSTLAVGTQEVVREALSPDIVLSDFLTRASVGNGEQYVRQIATGTTAFLPVHYYRIAAGLTNEQLLETIEGVTTRSVSKKRLLERIRTRNSMQGSPPSTLTQHASSVARRAHFDRLAAGEVPEVALDDPLDSQYFLQAIGSLDDDSIRLIVDDLWPLLHACFDRHYASSSRVADALRRAACRIDAALYGDVTA